MAAAKYPESRPYLIGVAGPSCAGKTELSRSLAIRLSAALIPLDCYYFDLSDHSPAERSLFNFDDPAALDHDLFLGNVLALSQGREAERPVYDFASHTRLREFKRVKPERFVIVEGLFVLYWQEVRSLLGTKVFVDLPDEACLERRILRDVSERGRSPESVRRQYAESVRPMADLYVRPSRALADVVISGDQPLPQSVRDVLEHIEATGVRLPRSPAPNNSCAQP